MFSPKSFRVLHFIFRSMWSILKQSLYKVWALGQVSDFCTWMSNCPSTICWKDSLFSIELPLHLGQKSIVWGNYSGISCFFEVLILVLQPQRWGFRMGQCISCLYRETEKKSYKCLPYILISQLFRLEERLLFLRGLGDWLFTTTLREKLQKNGGFPLLPPGLGIPFPASHAGTQRIYVCSFCLHPGAHFQVGCLESWLGDFGGRNGGMHNWFGGTLNFALFSPVNFSLPFRALK